MMCGTDETQVLERRRKIVVCQNSREEWLFDVFVRLRWAFFVRKLADLSRIVLIMR